MKKFTVAAVAAISAIGILGGCGSNEPTIKTGKYEGETYQSAMSKEGFNAPKGYNHVVCKYVANDMQDGYFSDADFEDVVMHMADDMNISVLLSTDYDARKIGTIMAISVLSTCPEYTNAMMNVI